MCKVEYVVNPHKQIHTITFDTQKEMNEWIEQKKRIGIVIVSKSSM